MPLIMTLPGLRRRDPKPKTEGGPNGGPSPEELARQLDQLIHSGEWRGDLREALRLIEEAERSLEKRSAGRPGAAGRLEKMKLRRADLLVRLGRGAAAAALLAPLAPSPRIAELLARAGRYEEALDLYLGLGLLEEATRLAAKAPQGNRLLARIHLHAGRPVDAGDLLARIGMAREAAEAYEAGREWGRAAYRWEAAGEPRRAAEAYEKAGRRIDAERCFALAGLPRRTPGAAAKSGSSGPSVQAARKHLEAGDKTLAASLLLQMRPEDPDYGDAAVLLAPLLIGEGFFEDALDRLRRIPDGLAYLERNYWEGRCFEAMNRQEAARAAYERVAEREPRHRDALLRLERLRELLASPSRTVKAAPSLATLELGMPEMPEMGTTPVVLPGGLAVGSRLAGRYEILSELGRGGMGRVYKAHDHEIGQVVAIKTVLAESGLDDEARLLREVQICRRIGHPNVVRVYDLGRFDGGLFVTMECIEGSRLDEMVKRESPLPFGRIRSLVSEIAAGLEEAHALGIVHRDLKPGNVMATASRVKILDFGIASMAGLGARLTQAGTVMGSPMFMSPDQIRGLEVDGRSDLYSLGLIAYSLIAGREPFDLAEPMVLLFHKLREDPVDIREHRPETPEGWAALLARLLARNPDDRFQSAREVLEALAQLPD